MGNDRKRHEVASAFEVILPIIGYRVSLEDMSDTDIRGLMDACIKVETSIQNIKTDILKWVVSAPRRSPPEDTIKIGGTS